MKNKILITLSIVIVILSFLLFHQCNKDEVIETITKYDTITKVKIDTIDNTKPTEVKIKYITLVDTLKVNNTVEKIVYKDKEVKQYKYKDSLDNGIIESTILSDHIYKRDVKLKTFDKYITKTVTNTVVRNDFYLGGMVTLNPNKSVLNQSINVFYTHKGKFMIGTGIGFDNNTKDLIIPLTIAVKF